MWWQGMHPDDQRHRCRDACEAQASKLGGRGKTCCGASVFDPLVAGDLRLKECYLYEGPGMAAG